MRKVITFLLIILIFSAGVLSGILLSLWKLNKDKKLVQSEVVKVPEDHYNLITDTVGIKTSYSVETNEFKPIDISVTTYWFIQYDVGGDINAMTIMPQKHNYFSAIEFLNSYYKSYETTEHKDKVIIINFFQQVSEMTYIQWQNRNN